MSAAAAELDSVEGLSGAELGSDKKPKGKCALQLIDNGVQFGL